MLPDLSRERLLASIEAKSDQLTYENFIGGPLTFTIAGVSAGTVEQPVNIRLHGEPRPYRPSKTMRRVLVLLWGDDGHAWVGRSMTLYGDPSVRFGPLQVGGIKISHLSHISGAQTVNVTIKKGQKGPVTVQQLKTEPAPMESSVPHGDDSQPEAVPPSSPAGAILDEGFLWKKAGEIADMEGVEKLQAWFDTISKDAQRLLTGDAARWTDIKRRGEKFDRPLGA